MRLDGKVDKIVFIIVILSSILFVSFAMYRSVPKIVDAKNQNTENKSVNNEDQKSKDGEKK